MSTFNYTGIRDDVVIPKLTQFGNPVIMKRFQSTDEWLKKFDMVTSRVYWEKVSDGTIVYEDPTGTPTEYTSVGLLTNYTKKDIDGDVIKQGDVLLLTISLPSPIAGDTYTMNGVTWSYVDNKNIAPDNETTVLQKIQLRK